MQIRRWKWNCGDYRYIKSCWF